MTHCVVDEMVTCNRLTLCHCDTLWHDRQPRCRLIMATSHARPGLFCAFVEVCTHDSRINWWSHVTADFKSMDTIDWSQIVPLFGMLSAISFPSIPACPNQTYILGIYIIFSMSHLMLLFWWSGPIRSCCEACLEYECMNLWHILAESTVNKLWKLDYIWRSYRANISALFSETWDSSVC